MTLRQLEILRAIIRYHTTVGAARELGLSQPAVSNALKAMEDGVGFVLFERVNNRLFPTPEARELASEAEAIFSHHERLAAKLKDLKETKAGQLRIVATPPIGYGLVPQAMQRFLLRRPKVRVFFDVRRYEGVVEAVETGFVELGFAIGLEGHPALSTEAVFDGTMVCVMKPDHPLATKAVVSPRDLEGYPFIALERGTRLGEAVRAAFEKSRAPFRHSVEVRYCNTACVLAASGVGVAVVDPFSPNSGGSHELAIRAFAPKTKATAYAAWSRTRPLSRLARAFLLEVRKASMNTNHER